jgi:hypothetical protein
VQVKSVQFLPNKKGKLKKRVYIQGLKKRYVEKSPAFALAIYRVDTDEIFFVDGGDNVTAIYDGQKSSNKKHIAFAKLGDDSDVRIALHKKKGLHGDWQVPPYDAGWLSKRTQRLAQRVVSTNKLAAVMEALLTP